MLVNNGRQAKDVTIELAGDEVWHHYYYDYQSVQIGVDGLNYGGSFKPEQVTVRLEPESINCLTTYKVGLDGDAPR